MYRYAVDRKQQLVTVTFEGTLSDRDPIDYLDDLVANTAYGPGWRTLADFTSIEQFDLTTEGIREIVAASRRVEDRLKGAKLAIAATHAVMFGMGRRYEIM